MTPHWSIYREVVKHSGIRSKKWLRRPYAQGRRWSWAETRTGAARFQTEAEARAWANTYPGAQIALCNTGGIVPPPTGV